MKSKFFLALFATVLLLSCSPEKTALEDLETFTNRMEKKSSSWSQQEWDDASLRYDEITNTIERYEYSDEEIQYIGRLEGRCLALFMKYYASHAEEMIQSAANEFEGMLQGFGDIFDK